MDFFFNELWADRLQYVTFPLEAVGFSLTFIEVLKPELADRIELHLDITSEIRKIKDATKIEFIKYLNFCFQILLYLGLASLFLLFLYSSWFIDLNYNIFWFVLIYWLVILSILFGSSPLLRFLNKLSNGHALGSLGLILAFLGLFGEAYQYITMVSQ